MIFIKIGYIGGILSETLKTLDQYYTLYIILNTLKPDIVGACRQTYGTFVVHVFICFYLY